jgi:rhodanese-related sulfurtransferase
MSVDVMPVADTIDVAMLQQLRRHSPLVRVLDVRMGGEFESAHIPGSYNVPLDTLVEHLDEFARVEDPIVLVCQSGSRATQARARLASAGKRTLHVLDGGMNAWMASNGEVTRGDKQRWALDRQVRLLAGTVALASVLASTVVPKAKWLAGGVGVGLVYVAITDTCPITPFMAKLPYNRADPCDVAGVLAALNHQAA